LFQDVDTQLPAGHGVSIEVSVDFSYVGTDGQTRYSSARGVFDPNGVFPGAISNNLMTITSMGPAQNRFNFRISDVRSRLIDPAYYTTNFVTGSVEVHGVRFKLVSDSIQSVFMDVVVMSGGYQDIVQSRKFEGTAYILNENGEIFGAQPFIQGSVPAFKSPPVFDYILRSGTTID
ncbi:hypothetical protein KC717_05960, partial [Candidatus Dojkabacteria bacterium]|nr:hypothetical protein [Candidatus Dojkabacteria bacterium]